jgi:ribosome-associated protein
VGERSAKLARALLKLEDAAIARLDLDERLIDDVREARAVTSPIARRREERRLAGTLRDHGIDDVEAALAVEQDRDAAQAHRFKQAERWRTRLIEDDDAVARFAAEHAVDDAALRKHVADARSERDTKKPRGAGRALFRLVRDSIDR